METVRIWDPGWKKVGSGIRNKHPGSATLGTGLYYLGEEPLLGPGLGHHHLARPLVRLVRLNARPVGGLLFSLQYTSECVPPGLFSRQMIYSL
jgi:hypothetical protein